MSETPSCSIVSPAQTGRSAIVTLADGLGGRRDVPPGKYGATASRAEYARVIAEF
jgi:hypothetical protein